MKRHLYEWSEKTVKTVNQKIEDLELKLNTTFTDLKTYVEYVKLVKESKEAIIAFYD